MFASPHLLLAIAALGAPLATAPTNDSKPCTVVQASEAERTPVADGPGRAPIGDDPAPTDPRVERASLEEGSLAPGDLPPRPDFARLGTFVPDRAFHVTDPEGTPWVRGTTYRARFGTDGTSYLPALASNPTRTSPVSFRLSQVEIGGATLEYDSSAPALRNADRITYQRGSLTEYYEVEVDSIEQVFVFDELSTRGEITLRIGVTTDLTACEFPAGIEFADERGAVRYGRATAIDANGLSVPATTTLIGDEIEIRVPADFVEAATLPLVIDPVISSWFFAATGEREIPSLRVSHAEYDCAYDMTTGRWLVVWTENIQVGSGSVNYLAWRLVGALNGQTVASGQIGVGTAQTPRCANNNASNQFLVTWLNYVHEVWVTSISAVNGAQSGHVRVGGNGIQPLFDLSIGGDPYPSAPSYFLVSWRSFSGTVNYRMLNGITPLGPEVLLATRSVGNHFHALGASRSNGGSYWNVAWAEGDLATYDRVIGTRISWSGAVLPSSTLQTLSGAGVKHLTVSPALDSSSTWAIASSRANGVYGDDVYVSLVNGTALIDDENLTLLTELSGAGTRQGHQQFPCIDTDGRSFAVTYTDWLAGGPGNDNSGAGRARVATVAPVGNQLLLSEAQTIDYGDGQPPMIASTRGSGLAWRLNLAVYKSLGEGYPILGALYDNALFTSFCHPGYDGVATCPCGNSPIQYGRGCNNQSNTGGAKLYGSGISSVSSDSMLLTGLNLPTNQTVFFYQGTSPLSTAVFSGRGLRCVGGTHILLYTKPSYPLGTQGYSTAPNPGDVRIAARSAQLGNPILAGQTRQYYASYRTNGTSGGGNGFAACTVGFSANTTQSLQAVWIP